MRRLIRRPSSQLPLLSQPQVPRTRALHALLPHAPGKRAGSLPRPFLLPIGNSS
ncbi:hypothetical protein LINPERHAP1_LOCUS7065 [Linum perenne]